MDRKERVQRTYYRRDAAHLARYAPRLQNEPELTAFAIEMSHHVRKQVIGITMERPENLVLIVPREIAGKVMGSNGINDEMALLSQCNVYVDGEPFALWPGQAKALEKQPAAPAPAATPAPAAASAPAVSAAVLSKPLTMPAEVGHPPAQTSLAAALLPARDLSPEALQQEQASYQGLLDRVVRALDAQAHFISYAPPALVAFRNHRIFSCRLRPRSRRLIPGRNTASRLWHLIVTYRV